MAPRTSLRLLLALCLAWLVATPAAAESLATNRVENCDGFYPHASSIAEGTTLITAHIPLEGNLIDPALSVSSGSKDLDAAAVVCASHFYVKAASKDGIPVETTWVFRIIWRTPGHGHSFLMTARPNGYPTFCDEPYPAAAVRVNAEGRTSLAYVIDIDGSVTGLHVAQSSGNKYLDDASLACVARWHYFPMTVSGKPIAVDWQTILNWHLH